MAHNSVSRQIQKFKAKRTLLTAGARTGWEIREFERVIMQSYISKHRQNKIQFVSHPNTSLVSPFTLLLFIGYCWNWLVVRKTCLPISIHRNRKSKTEDLIVSSKRENFTLELTIKWKSQKQNVTIFCLLYSTLHYNGYKQGSARTRDR